MEKQFLEDLRSGRKMEIRSYCIIKHKKKQNAIQSLQQPNAGYSKSPSCNGRGLSQNYQKVPTHTKVCAEPIILYLVLQNIGYLSQDNSPGRYIRR